MPTWTPSPQPINPTPTVNVAEPNPVQITELAHVQVLRELVVAVKFQNILPDALLRDVNYEVLALDDVGNRIAQEAGVPIVLAFVDYGRKVGGLGPVFEPTGDLDADMATIKAFYAPIKGKNADQFET